MRPRKLHSRYSAVRLNAVRCRRSGRERCLGSATAAAAGARAAIFGAFTPRGCEKRAELFARRDTFFARFTAESYDPRCYHGGVAIASARSRSQRIVIQPLIHPLTSRTERVEYRARFPSVPSGRCASVGSMDKIFRHLATAS